MKRHSWLNSLLQRLTSATIGRGTRRKLRTESAVSAIVEHLEPRKMLTGLVIHPSWDPSITDDANATTIKATINHVIADYQAFITDPITVNITFKVDPTIDLGRSDPGRGYAQPYTTFRNALVTNTSSSYDATALSKLPNSVNEPVHGLPDVMLWSANMKVLGIPFPLNTVPASDGTITINTQKCNLDRTTIDSTKFDLAAVTEHEIDEILGLGSDLNFNQTSYPYVRPEDLFRYAADGSRSYTPSTSAVAYFSLDGVTHLEQFDRSGGTNDYGDWLKSGTPHVQDSINTKGATPDLNVEFIALDAIGYHYVNAPSDLRLSNATVTEHRPVGTVVGRLSTLEPNSPGTVTYSLDSGTGDHDNGSFSIDANGNVITNQTLDFATQHTFSIRVRATDQFHDSTDKVFTISLLHAHAAEVLTVDVLGDAHQVGHTTLREAIAIANADAPGDSIRIPLALRGTIVLTQGALSITNSMTISGAGDALQGVSGNNASRVFVVDDGNAAIQDNVTITGLSLINGKTTSVGSNYQSGGAIYNAEQLSLFNDIISGNLANGNGGGLENVAFVGSHNNTFSANIATGAGGAVDNLGTFVSTNDTFASDSAGSYGGGISNNFGLVTTIAVTIAGNSAILGGAGFDNISGRWNLVNTIVAGNQTHPGSASDVANSGGSISARNSLIGNAATAGGIVNGVNGNLVGAATNAIFVTDASGKPLLASNGGVNPTIALKPGSPAMNHGGNLMTLFTPLAATSTSFSVTDNTFIVTGEFLQIDDELVYVTGFSGNNVNVVRAEYGTTAVDHTQNSAITLEFDQRRTTRASNDIGAFATPTPTGITLSSSTVLEHSTIGTFVAHVNPVQPGPAGTYTFYLSPSFDGASFFIDSHGNLNTAQTFDLATQSSFLIDVRATNQYGNSVDQKLTVTVLPAHASRMLTVDILGDSPQTGHTTLRDAIRIADSDAPGDTILFANGLTGTIGLTQGELAITNRMSIRGPGAGIVAIAGSQMSRIFNIDDGNPQVTEQVSIKGLTFIQGFALGGISNSGSGGAINNVEQLTLFGDVFSSNRAATSGGAICNFGTLNSINDTFSGNSAGSGGGGIENHGDLSSSSDTFSANTTNGSGGGIDSNGISVIATNDTFFGNSSSLSSGGGIASFGPTLITKYDTIASNTAFANGAGVYNDTGTWDTANTIDAGNTIVANNSTTGGTAADVMNNGGTVVAHNTLIGNAATAGGITAINGNIVGAATTAIFITDDFGKPLLTNNGGSTPTIALKTGSPAIGHAGPLTSLFFPIAASDTTLLVKDTTFIAPGDAIRIDSETLFVTDVSMTGVSVLRGTSGSIAAAHDANAPITLAYDQTGTLRASNNLGAVVTPVTSFNHAPMGTANTVTTLENMIYTFKASDFGFTDPLNSPPNTLLAVTITTLPLVGTLTNNGVEVPAGERVSIADITVGKLRYVPLGNGSGAPYTHFTFLVQDNGGTASGAVDTDHTPRTMTLDVTPVNTAPVGKAATISMSKNTTYAFKVIDFGFTDPLDTAPNSFLSVKITTLPILGTLTDNNVVVAKGAHVSVADIAAGKLKFTPIVNGSGAAYANFTFQVQDNGGTVNGGIDTDLIPKGMTIKVT